MASGTDSSSGKEKASALGRTPRTASAMAANGPTTDAAAPKATQRSCWRSTPSEPRKRSTAQRAAAGTEANRIAKPAQLTTAATEPAQPWRANGLATGSRVWVIGAGSRHQPTAVMAAPARAATATGRQRGERSRPSGSSSSGRVMARAMPTAQKVSPIRARFNATTGSGRPDRCSWSTHGSTGT
jgi:hypothetical protein